jgi:hypothetical protein
VIDAGKSDRLDRLADALAIFVLAALLAVLVDTAYSLSLTSDEAADVAAGIALVTHGEDAIFPEHPPLVPLLTGATLHALGVREGPMAAAVYEKARKVPLDQWGYAERIVLGPDNATFRFPFALPGTDSIVTAARLPLLIFPLIAALAAYVWARGRFGPRGGLVALLLVATYPDLLGHGALATTDAPLAAMALLSGLALDRSLRGGARGWLLVLGVALGALLAAKLSALFLLGGFAVAALVPGESSPRRRALGALVVGAIALLVLSALYLGANPVRSYRVGIDALRSIHDVSREGFLLGRSVTGPALAAYLPVVATFKLPLGTLALLGTAALVRSRRGTLAEETCLHAPALVAFLALALFAPPYGSRYLLAVVPFLLVSAGRLVAWASGSRARSAAIVLALLANVAGVASEHPFHASATNLLAGGEARAYAVLDNSNIDWGGGLKGLAAWQQAHRVPRLVVVPRSATPFRVMSELARGGPPPVALSADQKIAALAAYGIGGDLQGGSAVFFPEKGRVYAISAHVLSHALVLERTEKGVLLAWPPAGRVAAPVIVLGRDVAPSAVVGGAFLIFDLR